MKDLNTVAFHCIGNHDHDPYCTEDLAATQQWRDLVMPTYYSFNIGKAHFVCLDDIAYINNGGAVGTIGDKSYKNYVTEDQFGVAAKGSSRLSNTGRPRCSFWCTRRCLPMLRSGTPITTRRVPGQLLDCFEGFSEVHVLSGHSHDNRNCQLTDAVIDHNTGAVCACWWWSGVYTDRHIARTERRAAMGFTSWRARI